MKEMQRKLVIIGGGPAGMAAAVSAYDAGLRDIVILERDHQLGGILTQCIHNGFGLHRFGEELTGPEYAGRYVQMVEERADGIQVYTSTTVTSLTQDKVVTAMNREVGMFRIQAGAIVLAMGCRERPRGALSIPGHRPSGIYTAGSAQKFVNLEGLMPGREVVILGSGDIGLIMARRMTLEGAKVKCVCELMPYSGGLIRNIEQCLNDFDIPLKLSHTVTKIHGKERLEGVTISKVDERRAPIPGTEEYIPCDTLLLSCGLIPENELTRKAGIEMDPVTGGARVNGERETSVSGIFSAGNVLHVHDLVDYVSEEASLAGLSAVRYLEGQSEMPLDVKVKADGFVRYTVPQSVRRAGDVKVYFRVADVLRNAEVTVTVDGESLYRKRHIKLAPGEMECVTLKEDWLVGAKEVIICAKGEERK